MKGKRQSVQMIEDGWPNIFKDAKQEQKFNHHHYHPDHPNHHHHHPDLDLLSAAG